MRVCVKIGDIYEVRVNDADLAYFQFIGKDKTQLNSDVIRVFRARYTQRPTINEILVGEVECYLHTIISVGIKDGFWERIGNSDNLGVLDIWFRVNKSYLKDAPLDSWEIWRFNVPRVFVGKLPDEYESADIGFIDPPLLVMKRLIHGKVIDS